jgi:Rrf2 family protein
MLTPSKKIFYAIEAVLFIAYNAKASPVAGSTVAEAQNLPTRYLEPIMQKLVRAGILRGVRGPQGGYVLGRERRRITVADICAVITDAALPASSTVIGKTILTPTARDLMREWNERLGRVNIATLCEQAEAASIATTTETPTDFTI